MMTYYLRVSNFRRQTIRQLGTDFCPIGNMLEKIIGVIETGLRSARSQYIDCV
jgi:hypothetical protein